MLKQSTREVKDVNDLLFYKVEKRRIDKLNQALGKIKLTKKGRKDNDMACKTGRGNHRHDNFSIYKSRGEKEKGICNRTNEVI